MLHDPACGKTPTVCVYLWYCWNELKNKGIWIMPKTLLQKNLDELLVWSNFTPADVKIIETVPEDVVRLELMGLAIEGRLRIRYEVDKRRSLILHGAKTGTLKMDGTTPMVGDVKANKPVLKRLIKLGVLAEDLTLTDKEIELREVTYWSHLAGKKAEEVSNGRVGAMLKDKVLVADGNYVRVTDKGLAVIPTMAKSLEFDEKVLLMGFDFFSDNWSWIKKYNPSFDVVAADEIHHSTGYSTHGSGRTQKFYEAMTKFKRFVPMTGTLVNGRLDSAYPTIHVLEPRYYPNYYSFMAEHAIKDTFGSVQSWRNHGKIKEILKRHASRLSFEQVHGPESKIIIPEFAEMGPMMRDAYDEFHELAMLELEDEFLDGTKPGVHVLRARQIIQCPEIFGLCKGEQTGKDAQLSVHLEDRARDNEKFIVFSVFIAEQERNLALIQSYGIKAAIINCNTSTRERAAIDEAFRVGNLQAVVCSEVTAGVGLNWGHVNYMHFTSYDYQDGNFLQAYRRAIRGKRTSPLRLYLSQYRKSIDQRILRVIDRKSQDAFWVDPTRTKLDLAQMYEDA